MHGDVMGHFPLNIMNADQTVAVNGRELPYSEVLKRVLEELLPRVAAQGFDNKELNFKQFGPMKN